MFQGLSLALDVKTNHFEEKSGLTFRHLHIHAVSPGQYTSPCTACPKQGILVSRSNAAKLSS